MPRREEDYGVLKITEISKAINQGISSLVGGIDQLVANTNEGAKVIWDGANRNPQVLVGSNWEVDAFYNASSTVGWWGIAITVVATLVPAAQAKQGRLNTYISAGSLTDHLAFNMGAMPAGVVNLRVKLWITDTYSGITLPPIADW